MPVANCTCRTRRLWRWFVFNGADLGDIGFLNLRITSRLEFEHDDPSTSSGSFAHHLVAETAQTTSTIAWNY